MILCSLALNPDGSAIHPNEYEVNHAQVMDLLWATVAVLAVCLLLAAVRRRRATRIIGGLAFIVMALHPWWTVGTRGGDCGLLQVWASWFVLGLEAALAGVQIILLVWRTDRGSPVRNDYDDRRVGEL